MKNDQYYMEIALKEAKKASKKGEIPVGAIIVSGEKIVAKAHNLRDSKKVVTKHAEIIAIEKANHKKKNWRLNDCVLYCTLEPCSMCKEVIKACKLKKVVYAAKANEEISSRNVNIEQIESVNQVEKSSTLIKTSFQKIRDRKQKL